MTVSDLLKDTAFKAVSLPEPEREIDGAYVGDLLSWVMGRAEENNVWITIMSNANVIAVATLTDVSAVILAEGVTPDDEITSLAREKSVNLITTSLPSYECAVAISGKLK